MQRDTTKWQVGVGYGNQWLRLLHSGLSISLGLLCNSFGNNTLLTVNRQLANNTSPRSKPFKHGAPPTPSCNPIGDISLKARTIN